MTFPFVIQIKSEREILPWCCARHFDGSQIPVIKGGFELRTSYIQCGYLTH